jgi:hypothetical protein
MKIKTHKHLFMKSKILLLLFHLLIASVSFAQITPVDIGTVTNDGSGDKPRTAFTKVNNNFDYLAKQVTITGTDTKVGTPSPALTTYAGTKVTVINQTQNTGAVTVNFSALGPIAVTKNGGTALAAGDLKANTPYTFVHNGTNYELENGLSSASGFVPTTTTVNGHALSSNVTVTASDVGLGNVDNTSDVNKPVSTAQSTAINAKQATLVSGTNIKTINGTSVLGSGDIATTGSNTLTINEQTTNYTLTLADQTSLTEIVMNSASPVNLTIPTHASVAFPAGTQILLRNKGAGLLTVVLSGGVTAVSSSGTLTLATGYSALLIQTQTFNAWTLDNGSSALASSDVTTALGYTPWATTGTTTVTNPTITQNAASSGTTSFLTFSGAAHTGQTASTELIDINFAMNRTITLNAGSYTTQRTYLFQPPTIAFTGASTVTNPYTVFIGTAAGGSGAPVPGTNATFTNRYAFGVGTVSTTFNVSNTLTAFTKFAGTGLTITNGGISLLNGSGDASLANTIQVGTISNVASITNAGSGSIVYNSSGHTETSGTILPHSFAISVAPSSGTAVYKLLSVNGTVNQTGGANGNVSALKIEPSWTAVGGSAIGLDYDPVTGTPTTHYGLLIRPAAALSGFATATPNSTVHVNGSAAFAYVSKTALYTLTATDYLVEVTSGTHTQTLPTAVGITGRKYIITNTGSGTVTVGTTSSQTFINVSGTPTTQTLAQFATITVMSNGTNWLKI